MVIHVAFGPPVACPDRTIAGLSVESPIAKLASAVQYHCLLHVAPPKATSDNPVAKMLTGAKPGNFKFT